MEAKEKSLLGRSLKLRKHLVYVVEREGSSV